MCNLLAAAKCTGVDLRFRRIWTIVFLTQERGPNQHQQHRDLRNRLSPFLPRCDPSQLCVYLQLTRSHDEIRAKGDLWRSIDARSSLLSAVRPPSVPWTRKPKPTHWKNTCPSNWTTVQPVAPQPPAPIRTFQP